MGLDSSSSSLQCGRPIPDESPALSRSGRMTAEVKGFSAAAGTEKQARGVSKKKKKELAAEEAV